MQLIASTCPSSTWLRRNLRDSVTCTIRRRVSVSLVVRLGNTCQTCFHMKQPARSWRVSHTAAPSHQFCDSTDKPKPDWFWDPNQETVTVILRLKSPNRSCRFWGPNRETLYHLGFEAQPRNRCHQFWGQHGENRRHRFEAKPEKTVPVILRLNHWQTIDLSFEAQLRNSRSSSPH
jgi:hypothetical protein